MKTLKVQWLNGIIKYSLSFFRDWSNESEELLGSYWFKASCLVIVGPQKFPKIESLGRGGDKGRITWNRGGGDVEMGGLPLFNCFTGQLHLLCVGRKSKVCFSLS